MVIFKMGQGACCFFFFAFNGWQHFHYVNSLPNRGLITGLTWTTIVDSPLTLIFELGQGAFLFFFCIQRLSGLLLCITTTKLLHNYQTYKTKNHWRSVDAHFQDRAGSVLLSLVSIKGGNTSIMCIHYQITFLLPDLQDLKSLTLRWRSFCHGCNHNMEPFTLTYYINNGLVAAVLCCSRTFSFLTTLFFNDAYKYTL